MDMDLLIVSLPATVALIFKLILLLSARRSALQNQQTKIFLFLLFALSLQNIAEISSYFVSHGGRTPLMEGYLYFAASILILAFLLHLALSLTLDALSAQTRTNVLWILYGYATVLMVLLLFTPWLVSGFAPLGVSYYRIPGKLYPLFEVFALASFAASIGLFAYGSLRQNSRSKRVKSQFMLIGMLPMTILVEVNVILMHFGINWINTPINFPLTVTFFLIVTTYAVHQYRLFDIQFYLPWSQVRKRKTAFYGRIRKLVAEIADLTSSSEVVDRLASALGCPVALVGVDQPVLALAGGSRFMAEIPKATLRRFDRIIVANEIADSCPDFHTLLQHHGVAAVVPFHPHSQHAAGWLLLGESFSEHVYTKLDFEVVEQLFDRMADLFLDKLLTMRGQLAEASRSIRDLQNQHHGLTANLATLQRQNETLLQQNAQLRREQPIDSLAAFTGVASETILSSERFAAAITLLARDKEMLKRLRSRFSQVASYVSVESAGFRQQTAADVLVVCIDGVDPKTSVKLSEYLTQHRQSTAALLYGPAAHQFVVANRAALLGGLIEVMPDDSTEELVVRRVRALAALREAFHADPGADQPLVGHSQVFAEQMAAARQFAGFNEPLLLNSTDPDQAVALAARVHVLSGRQGLLRILCPERINADQPDFAALADEASNGSLVIPQIHKFSPEQLAKLLNTAASAGDVRVIAVSDATAREDRSSLVQGFRPFVIEMPSLRERKSDVPLLIHYFTLQFNLQSGTSLYLGQSEVDELLASSYPQNVANLKWSVYTRLSTRLRGNAGNASEQAPVGAEITDKTLDDCVAEFEARIITQTLERCGGNKSKAARLLGLRPNTLHYKLERYAIGKHN